MSVRQPAGAILSIATGTVTDAVFSPDGATVYVSRNGTVYAYNAATGTVTGSWTLGTNLGGMDVSLDGHTLLVTERQAGPSSGSWPYVTTENYVYKLDLTTGTKTTYTTNGGGSFWDDSPFFDVNFTSDGKALLTASDQWTQLVTLDLVTGNFSYSDTTYYANGALSGSAGDGRILFSPAGISDAPMYMYQSGVGVVDGRSSYQDNISGYNRGIQAFSPSGNLVAQGVSLAVYDGDLNLITRLDSRYPELSNPGGLAFSPDGSMLYVLNGSAQEVFVLSTSTWNVLGGYPVGAPIDSYGLAFGNSLQVSSDGARLAIISSVSVQVIDLNLAISDSATSGNDVVTGTSANDILFGFEGNDVINGSAGYDQMWGGAGDDTYYVDNQSDNVLEMPGAGNDIVYSSVGNAYLPGGVETLVLTGTAQFGYGTYVSDTLIGNELANSLFGESGDDVLIGNAGNDTLQGSYGNDTMIGGTGDDTYWVDSPADIIQEEAGQGIDRVVASFHYSLSSNVENLDLQGSNLTGHGNALDNRVTASSGDDTLYGEDGDDWLSGGSGFDVLIGGAGADSFAGFGWELNGDIIVDFATNDRIVFLGAELSNFSFSLSGNTLTYTGGSLTLENLPEGRIVARAVADTSGGVELAVVSPINVSPAGELIRAGDFNGDGRDDILWRNDNGGLTNWLGQANGAFSNNYQNANFEVSTYWTVVGAGDFDGNGRDDILWRNDEGVVTNWLGQSSGGFENNYLNSNQQVSGYWSVLGVADFNGDGRDDILWRNDDGGVTNWLGQADGGFQNNYQNANDQVSTYWSVAGIGDFNGDGRGDILWRNADGGLTNWLGQANGGFTNNYGNLDQEVSTYWSVAGTGDFNGDGRDDILWRNDEGVVTDWLGQANGGFANNYQSASYDVSTYWSVSELGDFNGDGRDDILWRNGDSHITDWLGQANGSFSNNYQNASYEVSTYWHVQPVSDLLV